MALLGGNEQEKTRKSNLKILEDKRVAFAEKNQGLKLTGALYVQSGGGFKGVGIAHNGLYLFTGPGPGDEADFSVRSFPRGHARLKDERIEAEGAAGILGFGKKGGQGYTLSIDAGDELFEMQFISGYNFLLEVLPGTRNPLLDPKRRSGNANFVWDMRSVTYSECKAIFERWRTGINTFEIE